MLNCVQDEWEFYKMITTKGTTSSKNWLLRKVRNNLGNWQTEGNYTKCP